MGSIFGLYFRSFGLVWFGAAVCTLIMARNSATILVGVVYYYLTFFVCRYLNTVDGL